MSEPKILNVAGRRPNLIKLAPLMVQMKQRPGIRPDGLASKRIVSVLLENAGKIKQLYRAVRERNICLDTLSPVS